MHATLDGLEELFDRLYPINHRRPRERAPAMGRFAGDVYYSGGAYYFSTLGAAEFCFLRCGTRRAAKSAGSGLRAATDSSQPFARSRPRAATFRAVRSTHRRADVGEASRVELRGLHLLHDGATGGGLPMTSLTRAARPGLDEAARAGAFSQARMIYRAIFASPVGRGGSSCC